LTLVAGIRCADGLIIAADTEEVLGDALRTYGEKVHLLYSPMADWKIVLAGAGDLDYILMVRDLIEEKVKSGGAKDTEIIEAIRESIHEMWRDYARFEPGGDVQLRLLIGSWSSDRSLRFTVVSGAAVRGGRNIEAMGKGDAAFLGMADRFLPRPNRLSFVSGEAEAIRTFMIYAVQAAKQVPGVGGNTRVVTLGTRGDFQWEKSFKIMAIQRFFSGFHNNISLTFSGVFGIQSEPENLVKNLSKITVRELKALRKELERIENDPSLA
jgi:hypothetical protein